MFAEIELGFGISGDIPFYKERQETLAGLTDHCAQSISEIGTPLAGFEVLRVGEDVIHAFRIAPESQCDISVVSSVVSGYCVRSHKQPKMHDEKDSDIQKPYKELPQGHYLFELQPIQR